MPRLRRTFVKVEGVTHPYMTSSPACWARYGLVLAREHSEPDLLATHRLSVDTHAVQHPGDRERRSIQSVGLHLARLSIQLENSIPPRETNQVMLGLGKSKATLPYLTPPTASTATVADIPLDASLDAHLLAVRM
jgi:hypothetical protein